MRVIANFDIKSDMSVISDDTKLVYRHPKGDYQVRLKNIVRKEYTTPFILSCQIIFEAPVLKDAPEIAEEKLADFLNMLAFVTGASVKRHRIKQIVDCTPEAGMRECLVWADPIRYEDPQPFIDGNIIDSVERLLQFDLPPEVRRALRWYRIGIQELIQEDQFQYFWFALEILAEYNKSPKKVEDKCPRCKTPLYCEKCETHPTHRPYAKQAIRSMAQMVDQSCDDQTLDGLEKARNALMHGATIKDIEGQLPDSCSDLVDVLGGILFKALLHQFPKNLFKDEISFGFPNSFVHRTLKAIARISAVVPVDEDGELDLDRFTSPTVSMVINQPPQSGRPTLVVMTPDQHKQMGSLAREKGDHQELCKRVYERVQMAGENVVASVLATDMAHIQAALKRGETGNWQDLFRDILKNQRIPGRTTD